MEPQAVPEDGHNLLYLCNPDAEVQSSPYCCFLKPCRYISGSVLLAKTMTTVKMDRIFCKKEITDTDLVNTLEAHGISIFDSVHSAGSGIARPSIVLSNDDHSYNLKFIVPPVSSGLDPSVLNRLSLHKKAVSIHEIPGMFTRSLRDAMFRGIELNLKISPDALLQTVSVPMADYLISEARPQTNFLSRYQTAHWSVTRGCVQGLQLLSTAAPLQEIGVADSTSQTAQTSALLAVNHPVPGLDYITLQICNHDYDLPAGTNAISGGPGCFHNAWLWVQRRNKQEAKYPTQIERELYEEDVFWKLGVPFAGLAVGVMGINQPDKLTPLKPLLLPYLYFLLLASMVCTGIGRSLKTIFPEASVLAMILSKALMFASFFTPILHLLPDGSPWLWIVNLTIAFMACTFFSTVGYSLWKDDVREPQKIKNDATV